MTDVVCPEVRSRMMAGIRGKNTRPELTVRKSLFRRGFRYRLHDNRLPGHPDLVLPRYRAAIFINGCFWHGHDCALFKWPSSRASFWRQKITSNRRNDRRSRAELNELGWRVLTVWECALKGRSRRPVEDVTEVVARWLQYRLRLSELRGKRK